MIIMDVKFEEMSNAEIKIKLVELENEYNVLQKKIKEEYIHLMDLDKFYIKGKALLNKRTGGRM